MKFRQIEPLEIQALERQGCLCNDWSQVEVIEQFRSDHIHNVTFGGKVRIGLIDGENISEGGIQRQAALAHCQLVDCQIGNRVHINNVGLIEGYLIDNHVIIQNVGSMIINGPTAFGNGVLIDILNEGGGRSLPIFNALNAQLAYLLVNHRYHLESISVLEDLIHSYCENIKASKGIVSEHTCISNTGTVLNIHFDPYSSVTGTTLLENGSLLSSKFAPVSIGHGVIAKNFIVQSGSHIESGVILDQCFVGQGVKLGKQFSAENSAFFANCEGFHGEAVSLFAGPYSVTHHKSTLLIASMLSFFNAGSGTNQSNHMYKLGPLHQGILERGSKTGSFSYLLWPSKVGPYSVVMGKHGSNFDTSDFPFSYVTIENGKSTLTPAMNLFTVGTKRDTQKWPTRDRRHEDDKKDFIHFELFNPYIVGKMLRAIEILSNLYDNTPRGQKLVNYKGVTIPRLLLKTAKKYYLLGLKSYFGEKLIHWLERNQTRNIDDIRNGLDEAKSSISMEWLDLAGLITPAAKVEELHQKIKAQKYGQIQDVLAAFKNLYTKYETWSFAWFIQRLEKELKTQIDQITIEQIHELIESWRLNATRLNNMILQDAKKEFDQNSQIGYGQDGDSIARQTDFQTVRGSFEEDKFVNAVLSENLEIQKKADTWISILSESRTKISS